MGVLTSMMLAGAANAGELLVYSSTDADNLKYYMDNFQKDNPDIKVKVVRESTGTMAAKMMAEKDNPQADVLFEMAATVALNMETQGMFHPYTPKGMDKIGTTGLEKIPCKGVKNRNARFQSFWGSTAGTGNGISGGLRLKS